MKKSLIIITLIIFLLTIITYFIFKNIFYNSLSELDKERIKSCEGKEEQEYNTCIDSIAALEKNKEYCQFIKTKGASQYMRANGGVVDKYECYWHAIYSIGNEKACEDLNKGSVEKPGKDDCYLRLAIRLQKSELCNRITQSQNEDGSSYKDSCISGTTVKEQDCESIKWITERIRCYTRVALINQDISSCMKINSSSVGISSRTQEGVNYDMFKENCIVRLARSSLNSELCKNAELNAECISAVEKESKTPSFCTQNKTGLDRLQCYISN